VSGIRCVRKATLPCNVPQAAENAEDEENNAESVEETEYTVRAVACTWQPCGNAAVFVVGDGDATSLCRRRLLTRTEHAVGGWVRIVPNRHHGGDRNGGA
jgi:hypothetical protein